MSTQEQDLATETTSDVEASAEEPKRKLDLDVQISDAGPCKKHIKVAIGHADIEHQFNQSIGDIRKEAVVPGFRVGRAPRKLVERRFRKEVAGQVKSQLIMASLEQIEADHKLNAISQPDLDIEAIELPEEGPMTFEMDVEVQPEFSLPSYKAVTVKRPVREITDRDVEAQYKTFLERYAQIVPKFEGAAELGDFVVADLNFEYEGVQLNQAKEVQFRLQPELRFQDGHVPDLDKALLGAKPGEVRSAPAHIGSGSPDAALRGKTITVHFNVHDLKQIRLPEVNAEFLQKIGFDSQDELREALKGVLERRVAFQQRQAVRRAILDQLHDEVKFDLPADLVGRQEKSTLRRLVQEMRESGLSESEIRAREAEIRANAHEITLRSLKDFFLLSKIAETESLKVEAEDIDEEIEAIAARTDDSPRRIRARIEKEGQLENLATQIIERKAIDRILEFVKYEEVPHVEEKAVETLDQTAGPASAAEGEAESQG